MPWPCMYPCAGSVTTATHARRARRHHLPGAVVDVAVGVLQHALPILEVVEPLALVYVPAGIRLLPLQRTALHSAAHSARRATHHSGPHPAHPRAVIYDAVRKRQPALAMPQVIQVLALVHVAVGELVPVQAPRHARSGATRTAASQLTCRSHCGGWPSTSRRTTLRRHSCRLVTRPQQLQRRRRRRRRGAHVCTPCPLFCPAFHCSQKSQEGNALQSARHISFTEPTYLVPLGNVAVPIMCGRPCGA